jgi:peptide-methionine (S)-S-oxide reductase
MNVKLMIATIAVAAGLLAGCSMDESKPQPPAPAARLNMPAALPKIPDGAEYITLGAGCFWCTEAVFQQIPGVLYVCSGMTGHAEVSRVVFDPKKTSLEKILEVFWEAHDPTTLNRQGADSGTQYRSAIFYNTDAQKLVAEASKAAAGKEFSKPIVTEITAAGEFYPAEGYHQNYYTLNKNKNPYCSMVISPKLRKLGLKD